MDLDQDITLNPEDQKKYIEGTTLQQHEINVEETFESGTLEITEDLYKQAVLALQTRIDATEEYTKTRVTRIKQNYTLYHTEDLGVIKDAVDSWVDKLFNIFSNFGDTIKIEADGVALDEFLTQKLDVAESEDQAPKGRLRSLLKFLLKDKFVEKEIYYFMRKEVTQAFLSRCITKAEIKDKLEDFFLKGIVSGLFCLKESWGETQDLKIKIHKENEGSKNGKEYLSQGKLNFVKEAEPSYKLLVPDTRNLIFRSDVIEWVIEKISSNYWKLVEDSVDAEGKPKENAIYDYKMLLRIKKLLKDNPNAMPLDAERRIKLDFDPNIEMTNLYELEGNVEILEGHNIPLMIKNRPVKCIIAALNINNKLIPIRIQETSYVQGLIYKMVPFIPKEGDVAGIGLPEKIENITGSINEINADIKDLIRMSIKGITAGDSRYIVNPEKLKNLDSNSHIELKDTKGKSIREVIEFFMPNLSGINLAFELLQFYLSFTERLSRKGSGQKITPNPSATEATVIMDAQEQPINRVGLRLNSMFSKIMSNMYFYTLLNRDSRFALKLQGTKIKGSPKNIDPQTMQESGIDAQEKQIELTRDQLLIEGVQFTVEAVQIDDKNQPVQKQQYMQAIQLLWKTIGIEEQKQEVDPMTQQPITKMVPKTFIDDLGNEVQLDTFSILTEYLDKMGINSPWKPAKQEQKPPAPNMLPLEGAGGPNPKNTQTPPLTATPQNSNILGGAMQVK